MAEQNKILERIKASKIIAIVRGIPSSSIVDLVEAMVKGGVSCVEVTFDRGAGSSGCRSRCGVHDLSQYQRGCYP